MYTLISYQMRNGEIISKREFACNTESGTVSLWFNEVALGFKPVIVSNSKRCRRKIVDWTIGNKNALVSFVEGVSQNETMRSSNMVILLEIINRCEAEMISKYPHPLEASYCYPFGNLP